MEQPIQPISAVQWEGIKNTIAALEEASATSGEDMPDDWADLVKHWRALIVASTGDVQPYAITEHFLFLLQMYLDGAPTDGTPLGTATREVMAWAQSTLEISETVFGLVPNEGGDKCCWIVIGDDDLTDDDDQ